jgi:hypothetical protein
VALAEELAEATARIIAHQQLGMAALTEAPMELEGPAAEALARLMAAREALLAAAREWDLHAGDHQT